ncbi:MAG: alpha/beta hydrolase [Deltaproteobacteria bacterium]|nr:alpha/beta hydrolase [Deltaproteobacteria bacterium]
MYQIMKNSLNILVPTFLVILFSLQLSGCDTVIVTPTEPIEDGSTWIEEIEEGFGNDKNYAIVAMAEYKDYFYAMCRNEVAGAEIWRRPANGTTWEQVLYPGGETNGVYGNNWMTSMWGSLVVFNEKLYCGFSSGHQGNVYDSTGCEIWRYDGTTWEAVISDKKDTEDDGSITAISGCSDKDGDSLAQVTDSSQAWDMDQWKGAVLQITSGSGEFRRFEIVGNTDDTLTIQQNEVPGDAQEPEYTVCDTILTFKSPFPPYEYDRGIISVGDGYEIGTGTDENGFGDFWNKMITGMVIFEDKLYVSTGLNYDHGGQIWYTADGNTWEVTVSKNDIDAPYNAHSFGNYHTNPDYKDSMKPISTSIPSLAVSSVSGKSVLYAGGTGASGGSSATVDKGRCSRMARLTDDGWELIVDVDVDANDTGSNENGFGSGMDCTMSNGDFMPWSLVEFKDKLFVGIQALAGTRILYTESAGTDDNAWHHVVGGDSNPTGMPNGFDGIINQYIKPFFDRAMGPFYQNIVANLFVHNDTIYAGLASLFAPTLGATEEHLTGAHLWKSFDGISWMPVTRNGFGEHSNVGFDAFAVMGGDLYVSTSRASVDGPHGLEPEQGGMIYKLTNEVINTTPRPAFSKTAKYSTIMPISSVSTYGDDVPDETDIYYPVPDDNDTASYTFPIALCLQGGKVDKKYFSKFAAEVAKYGFIVVVPNHDADFDLVAMGGRVSINFNGFYPEHQQIPDVLDFMNNEQADPYSPLYGIVDNETIVLTGHSFGAAVIIGAIQNSCEFPLCRPEDSTFTLPDEVKAAALTGINTIPYGNPFDNENRSTANTVPMAIINGDLDENAQYEDTKESYAKIVNPPKALVFIKGANHYGLCDVNNPGNPSYPEDERIDGTPPPQDVTPTLDQDISIEAFARWTALFLRAHALDDTDALEYVSTAGQYLDPNIEVSYDNE